MQGTPILTVWKTIWGDGDYGPPGKCTFHLKDQLPLPVNDVTWGCGSEIGLSDISKAIGNLGVYFVSNPSPLIPNSLNHCVGDTNRFASFNSKKRELKSRPELASWFLIAEFGNHWSYLAFQLFSLYALQSWSLLIYSVQFYQEFTICKTLYYILWNIYIFPYVGCIVSHFI